MKTKLKVIFKKHDGEVFAAFPTLLGDMSPYTMCGYAHIGQHGAYCMSYVADAKPAKPEEYAPLLAELTQIYDDCELVIARKMAQADLEIRKAELAAICQAA